MALSEGLQQRSLPLVPALEEAFDGRRLRPERLKSGWSIVNRQGQQLCSLYYGAKKKAEHCLELAVSPSHPLGACTGEQLAQWMEQEIAASGRRGNVHSTFPYPVGH